MQLAAVKNIIGKIVSGALKHKFYTLIILAVLGGGGYFGYQKLFASGGTVRYVTAAAEKGVLTSSVSGTGQVSSSNEVDISVKASGDIIYVGAKVGDSVKAGALLVSLNAGDALKSVRDAEANLESSRLSLQKLEKPADTLSVLQAENSLSQAQESRQKADDDLTKAYEDGFNTVADAYLDLPAIMTGLHDMLLGNSYSAGQSNMDFYADEAKKINEQALDFRDRAYDDYVLARSAYDADFNTYKATSRYSDTATVDSLISSSYDTTKKIAEAIKSANNLVQFYKDKLTERGLPTQSLADTHLSSLNSYTGKTNSHLLSLLSIKRTIQTDKETIVNADRAIVEKTESLADLKAGTDPLDLRSAQLTVEQRVNSLQDAREKLAEYSARAKFDGVVAALTAQKGDTVSAGASLGTLITEQRIATIALNEVDVAKVKVGQKAMLTFDAVEDLNITGEVAEVDALGTTSQGVVSYNVKIAFDIQDDRIKSGMSVSANIILSSKPDVLLVSSAAVKTQGGASYVEVLTNGAPEKKTVTVGESNGTQTEILSGLNEGDAVITQTITVSSSAAKTSTAGSSGNSTRAMQGVFMGAPR